MKCAVHAFVFWTVLAFASCSTVQLTHDERDALKTVQKFVQLDHSGARLDARRHAAVAALTTWRDEPGWDIFIVVSGAAIGRPVQENGKIQARVRYDVEGMMDGSVFTPIAALDAETASRIGANVPETFTLVSTANGWRVESPQLSPHVGFTAARAFAKEMGAENSVQALDDAAYVAKLKGQRAGHCNCERLDF